MLTTGISFMSSPSGVSVPLLDLSGRRPLLLFSMLGMLASASVMTLALNMQPYVSWMAYLCVLCALAFILSYAIGLGCIPQFLGSEFFQQGPRPAAMALAAMLNWLANLAVALTFPLIRVSPCPLWPLCPLCPQRPALQRNAGSWVFTPYMACLLIFFVLLWYKLPESKNKSFAEIAQFFGINLTLLQSRLSANLEQFPPGLPMDDNVGFVQSSLTLHSHVSNV